MSILDYTPYSVDPEFEVRALLQGKILEAYDDAFEHIARFDSERAWEDHGINDSDKRVRQKVWQEIGRCYSKDIKTFSVRNVTRGELTEPMFYRWVKNPVRMGYYFTRPSDYEVESKVLLADAFQSLREILKLPHTDAKGRVVSSVVSAHLRIYQMLADRVLGGSIQRIQQHSVTETKVEKKLTLKEIEAELKILEGKSKSKGKSKKTDDPLVLEAETVKE